jgi:hypothetical protein
MNIYEFIDNKFSDDDMYRSNVARRGISRIAGKGVEQMQGGHSCREGGSMNKKSHEEELQEHINALEAKLEEEVKENIKHLGDLRYYEEVQIPELQKQLAEARAEIERLKTPMITDMREKMAALCHDQWAGWMEYLFLKSKQVDGCVIIPAWAVERWRRQVATRYPDLSEDEKNSDRNEADRFLSLFNAEIERKDALIEQMRGALNAVKKIAGEYSRMSGNVDSVVLNESPEFEAVLAALSAAEMGEGL